jgi:hypothetical protein
MRSFTVRGSESPGSKASVVRSSREGGEPIDEIVESGRSPLDSIVRDGARRMLQAALESEVDAFLEEHAVLLDECGRRRVVRNGYLPTREIATGAGILEVSQPRVRDKASIVDERIVFSSKILPPYLRKSRSMEELIPWLSLKGVSTGDFGEALESLIGPSAKGFSPNVIVRLKERWSGEYDEWSRRDLTGKQYVSVWADGIHVRIRLEDPPARGHGGHGRRPEGIDRRHRRRPREQTELARTAPRPQEPWAHHSTDDRCRRWCARLLGRPAGGLPDDA